MFTLSNFSRSDGYGHIFTFDLSWDPALWWEPAVTMRYVGGTGGLECVRLSLDTVAGTASYRATTVAHGLTSNWLTFFSENAIWEPAGFVLRVISSRKDYSIDKNSTSAVLFVGPAGMSYAGPTSTTSSIGTFIGYSFTDASPVGPADTQTIYCDSTMEEKSILNTPGSISNPIYSPLEAIQLAMTISKRFAHPVTVSITSGEYEITSPLYSAIDGGTVLVVRNGTAPVKVYVNEDMNKSTLLLGEQYPASYLQAPIPLTTSLDMSDIDWRGVNFIGGVKDFVARRCSFELCDVTPAYVGTFRLLDCSTSAAKIQPTIPLDASEPFPWKWAVNGNLAQYADPTWVSSKWPQFQRFMPTSESYLVDNGHYSQTAINAAKALGLDFSQAVTMTRTLNTNNRTWPHTSAYINLSKIDTYASAFEAVFGNSVTSDWSSYECVAEVRRCQFRDGSTVTISAALGTIHFTNNRYSNAPVSLTARKSMIAENNTGDFPVNVFRLELGSANSPVKGLGWVGTHNVGTTYPSLPGSFLRGLFTIGEWSVQGNIGPASTVYYGVPSTAEYATHYPTTRLISGFYGQNMINSSIQHLGSINTGMDQAQLPAPTVGFNAALVTNEFQDTIELRPKINSVYVNAGPTDPGKNDKDGSRNDQGHLGGPNADSALDAKIFWLDSFVPQNYTKIYTGMPLTLRGDRSTYSAARTPTFTWSATLDGGAWTPAGGWQSNGTNAGKTQTITLSVQGTYVITMVIDDLVATDNAVLTLTCESPRTFCVDSRKSEAGNVLPFAAVVPDKANWTFWAPPQNPTLPYADRDTFAANLDGVAANAMLFRHTASRTFTVPQANTRYYLKLTLIQEALSGHVNSDLGYRVLLLDNAGALLLDDTLTINGSRLLTDANAAQSSLYGVGSCYFFVGNSTTVTLVVMSLAPQATNFLYRNAIERAYLAHADVELDTIYQDLRLAIRHAKPNDSVQVADCALDVPLRIAGKAIAFNVTGGWDATSHDGTVYTTRAWQTYKTTLNYLRFAWFSRQRDWAYSAISAYLPVYFPSTIDGFHITNLWPDKPNSWVYDALDCMFTMHAPVTLTNIAMDGVYRAGNVVAVGDSLLDIENKLTIDTVDTTDCYQGLRVTTKHIDLDVAGSVATKVPGGALALACMRSPTVRRKVRLWGNAFADCGVGASFHPGTINRNDPIYRTMPSAADQARAQAQYLTGAYLPDWRRNQSASPSSAPVVLITDAENADAWADLEAWNNTWSETSGFETSHCVMYSTVGAVKMPVAKGAHHHWHDNTSPAGTSFIGLRGFTGSWEITADETTVIELNPVDLSAGTVADAVILAQTRGQSFVVVNNTLSDMRSVVDVLGSVPFLFSGAGSNVVVAGNQTTNVVTAFWWDGLSGMFPAAMDKTKSWFRVDNNGFTEDNRYMWNLLPGNPEAPINVLDKLVVKGQPAVQFLVNWL